MSDNSITIRNLTGADLPRAAELWLACFPEDDRLFVDYYFSVRTAPERMLGLFLNGDGEKKLVSMLCFERRRMRTGGGEKRVAFVAGVATDPAYRRRGFVRALFAELRERFTREGCAALLLQPFDFAFYEKLGFLPFARRRICRAAAGGMKASPDRPMAARTELTPALMNEAYTAGMRRPGALVREPAYFDALRAEYSLSGAHSLAFASGKGCAYALWWGGEEGGPLTLDELLYSDEAAARALLGALTERFSEVGFPVPAEGSPLGSCAAPEFFNMILPLKTPEGVSLEPDPDSFDLQRY